MSLHLIGALLDLGFIGLFAAALYFARGSARVRDLVIALRLYVVASAVQSADLGVDFATGGGWLIAVSVFTLACTLGCVGITARRIARKSGEVR